MRIYNLTFFKVNRRNEDIVVYVFVLETRYPGVAVSGP